MQKLEELEYDPEIHFKVSEYVSQMSEHQESVLIFLWRRDFRRRFGVDVVSSLKKKERQAALAIHNHKNSLDLLEKITDDVPGFRLGNDVTLLHYAALKGNVPLIRQLSQEIAVDIRCHGLTPAFFAVSDSSDEPVVDVLTALQEVEGEHQFNAACFNRTLVHQAVVAGCLPALAWLKADGFDMSCRTGSRRSTALHLACKQGYAFLAIWLMEVAGVSPFVLDVKRRSPLYYAYLPKPRIMLIFEFARRGIYLPQSDIDKLAATGRVDQKLLGLAHQDAMGMSVTCLFFFTLSLFS